MRRSAALGVIGCLGVFMAVAAYVPAERGALSAAQSRSAADATTRITAAAQALLETLDDTGRAKVQFHLPVLPGFFEPVLAQKLFDACFDMLGASGHIFGGAVAEETLGKFIAAIRFAAFFHFREPADMSRSRA